MTLIILIGSDLGGDKEHVQAVKGLVDIADAVRLNKGVLLPCCHQLWESGHQTLEKENLQPGSLKAFLFLKTSILDLVSSTNCLEMIALPVLLQTAAAISTMADPLQPASENVNSIISSTISIQHVQCYQSLSNTTILFSLLGTFTHPHRVLMTMESCPRHFQRPADEIHQMRL